MLSSPLRRAALAGTTMDERSRWARLPGSVVLLVVAAALVAGCTAKAKTANLPAVPPLEVPAPPPRDLPAVEEPATIASSLPQVPISEGASPVPSKTPQPGRAAAQQPPKAEPPAAATVTPPPEAAADFRPTSAEDVEKEKIIGDIVNRTAVLLEGMKGNVNRLSQGNREQYEDAKRFLDDARKALKEKRFSYAQVNAEKAQTIAQQLSK